MKEVLSVNAQVDSIYRNNHITFKLFAGGNVQSLRTVDRD